MSAPAIWASKVELDLCITTPHVPLPAADALEDLANPSVDRIVETVVKDQ